MEAEELIAIWKKQDKYIDWHLQQNTFTYLVRQQSAGVLSKIRRHLRLELLAITVLTIGLNGLFFLVDLPVTELRLTAYTFINLIALFYLYRYLKTLHILGRAGRADVRTALQGITGSLQGFRRQSSTINLPLGVIVVVMFSASQHLIGWLPWLLLEFLLWRWVLAPRMGARFERYLSDLEYALKNLNQS
jgi:hypothetical protein